jgi:hypothetical protein
MGHGRVVEESRHKHRHDTEFRRCMRHFHQSTCCAFQNKTEVGRLVRSWPFAALNNVEFCVIWMAAIAEKADLHSDQLFRAANGC